MRKGKREGYSLVELLVAMAVSAIVLSTLIALLSYGAHNMRRAHELAALQNQSKDASNHISSYVMEASDVEWDDTKKVLTVIKETVPQEKDVDGTYPEKVTEKCYYWLGKDAEGIGGIYFAKHSKVADPSDASKVVLTSKTDYLLTDDIQSFSCEVKKDNKTKKEMLHFELELQKNDTKFQCKKDIYLRNHVETTGNVV